jgi:hypothetical protein
LIVHKRGAGWVKIHSFATASKWHISTASCNTILAAAHLAAALWMLRWAVYWLLLNWIYYVWLLLLWGLLDWLLAESGCCSAIAAILCWLQWLSFSFLITSDWLLILYIIWSLT